MLSSVSDFTEQMSKFIYHVTVDRPLSFSKFIYDTSLLQKCLFRVNFDRVWKYRKNIGMSHMKIIYKGLWADIGAHEQLCSIIKLKAIGNWKPRNLDDQFVRGWLSRLKLSEFGLFQILYQFILRGECHINKKVVEWFTNCNFRQIVYYDRTGWRRVIGLTELRGMFKFTRCTGFT